MTRLTYLLDEICAGLEIYYSGRTGGQYLKSAFVLCDDYVELTSKLYLVENVSGWSDSKPSGRFKNFHDVTSEMVDTFESSNGANSDLQQLATRAGERRKRRNDFFHSTNLLDLNINHRMCVEAFVDLLALGKTLFGQQWLDEIGGARNLETFELLVDLEARAFGEPHLLGKLNEIISSWPKNTQRLPARGVQVASHPEDLHLRLCVINGSVEFRDRLALLLAS